MLCCQCVLLLLFNLLTFFTSYFPFVLSLEECNNNRLEWTALCLGNNTVENNNETCLSYSNTSTECPQIELLGINLSEQLWSEQNLENNATQCNYFHLISENVWKKEVICLSQNASFLQIVIQQESLVSSNSSNKKSNCVLLVQQYNVTGEIDSCNLTMNELLGPPYCISYSDCSLKSKIFETMDRMIWTLDSWEEEKADVEWVKELHSVPPSETKQSEMQRVDRPEVIRRIRKPFNWSWRDHVLELTILSIMSAILLLIALKICLSEKFMDTYQNSSTLDSKQMRCVPCNEKRRNLSRGGMPFDRSKPPCKPILKPVRPLQQPLINHQLLYHHHHRPHRLNQYYPNYPHGEIKSFESNSSIYYDAMEYPEGYSQPLI